MRGTLQRFRVGFFNIETDMLLLESLFFFAGDFCAARRDIMVFGVEHARGNTGKTVVAAT